MLILRQTGRRGQRYGAFDRSGKQVFVIENRAPECRVRRCQTTRSDGQGELLVVFLGPEAFENACRWAAARVGEEVQLALKPA